MSIILELTEREADTLIRVIRQTPIEVYHELIRENLPDPYIIGLKIQYSLHPNIDESVHAHDWVEVTSHQQAVDEKHFVCSHCSEFKIEKVA